MSNFEKGGQVSLVREKDPLVWPAIRTANVFRDPYPGWGPDRPCRSEPAWLFDVDFDPEERTREEFRIDLEDGEAVCLDCPLAVECRAQAQACQARGLFGAVVVTESGKAWPVDTWVRMKTGAAQDAKPEKPKLRECALATCPKSFTVSVKRANQKYCTAECANVSRRGQWVANKAGARAKNPTGEYNRQKAAAQRRGEKKAADLIAALAS